MSRHHGDYAWLGVFVAILGYETIAREGELLSEAADRYRAEHPLLTHLAVVITAVHLIWPPWLPERYDPWLWIVHGCARARRRLFPRRTYGVFSW